VVGVNRTALILVCVTIGLVGGSGILAPNARAAPGPTLSIVSPVNNAIVGNGSPVAIVFAVTNFNLTEPDAGPSTPDSGHAAVFVDGGFAETSSTNTVVIPLPSGPHAIRLQLVMNNGSALSPDVTASVAVMVTRGPATGAPGLSIASPREGALLGTDSTVSFRVTNFVLVPAGGPAGVPNEGRIRVRLDGANYSELTDAAPLHLNLKDGPHTLTLELIDNGGQSLTPAVAANLHVSVRALVGRVQPFDATPYFALANVLLGLGIVAAIYRKLEVD